MNYMYPENAEFLATLTSIFTFDGIKTSLEMRAMKDAPEIYPGRQDSRLGVLITAWCEEAGIEKTISSYIEGGFNPANIFVANDGSTDLTRQIAEVLLPEENVITQHNQGKVAACTNAIMLIKKERPDVTHIILADADLRFNGGVIPLEDLIQKDVKGVAFTICPIPKGYREGIMSFLLTAAQTIEYLQSMRIGRQFSARTNSVSCISGASGLFEMDLLYELRTEHSGIFTGDDQERTLIFLKNRANISFLDIVIETDVPDNFKELSNQRRTKWWPGLWRNLKLCTEIILSRKRSLRLRFELLYEMCWLLLDPVKIGGALFLVYIPGVAPEIAIISIYMGIQTLIYIGLRRKYTLMPPFWTISLWAIYSMIQSTWRIDGGIQAIRQKLFLPHWKNNGARMKTISGQRLSHQEILIMEEESKAIQAKTPRKGEPFWHRDITLWIFIILLLSIFTSKGFSQNDIPAATDTIYVDTNIQKRTVEVRYTYRPISRVFTESNQSMFFHNHKLFAGYKNWYAEFISNPYQTLEIGTYLKTKRQKTPGSWHLSARYRFVSPGGVISGKYTHWRKGTLIPFIGSSLFLNGQIANTNSNLIIPVMQIGSYIIPKDDLIMSLEVRQELGNIFGTTLIGRIRHPGKFWYDISLSGGSNTSFGANGILGFKYVFIDAGYNKALDYTNINEWYIGGGLRYFKKK